MDEYLANKEYIDTALVPLFKIELEPRMRESATKATWLSGVVTHLEEQLTGRVLLFPPVSYTSSHQPEELITFLNRYTDELLNQGFMHQIFITVEEKWLEHEPRLAAKILYIDVKEEQLDDQSSQTLFNHAQRYVNQLISLWRKA